MAIELPDQAVVSLGELPVGVLVRVGEHSRFEPAEKWAEMPAGTRPVLGQQFEEDPFSAHGGRTRMGVPSWFEHLLPERDGLLRGIVARAAEIAPSRGYALLLLLGDDLPGAVRVRPAGDTETFRTVARRVREANRVGDSDEPFLRVSLAGVQLKMSARLDGGRLAVPGWDREGDWIVKFSDAEHRGLPANEYATMRWARAAGIEVPDVRLVDTASIDGIEGLRSTLGDVAFAVERYDRTPEGRRVHQEDFAQVFGLAAGEAKYDATNIDSILRVVSVLAPDDVDELIRRIVFLVLSGNDDAHAKNWSLWYPDSVNPRLSPAYDQVATLAFDQYAANPMALKIAGARKFDDVSMLRLRSLASRAGVDPERVTEVVRESVEAQVAAWAVVREEPEVPEALRAFVDRRLDEIRLIESATTD